MLHKQITYLLLLLLCSCRPDAPKPDVSDWPAYLGGKDANHYSPLNQVNSRNIHELEQVWEYHSGDADAKGHSQIQCNPLVIDGILYGTSPKLKLLALNAATGKELWRFDPYGGQYDEFGMGVNRGVAYWEDGDDKRILFTASSFLYAIDALTGKPVPSFGTDGKVDLHKGLDRPVDDLFIVSNTPGIVYRDLLILGSRVSESVGPVPGHIRAYNIRTGEVAWIFHTIPHPGEYGYETWPPDAWKHSGGANAWSGMSLDEKRGMVYIPTGSASFDFYGGDRHGQNLFANCILALDASTGQRLWHFQTVHHDLWDRDLPAPPNLVTVNQNGKELEAVAQITKSGHVFLLNRETGNPVFEVEERPVPPSMLEGEQAWPTQPFPVKPPPFSRQSITEADLPQRSREARDYAHLIWSNALKGEAFSPPAEQVSFLFPGFDGGGEWGGAAVDKEGILYVNSSEMPWLVQMEKQQGLAGHSMAERGQQIFQSTCIACHGEDLKGNELYGNIPSLLGLNERMQKPQFTELLRKGKGLMPSFSVLSESEVNALSAFLLKTKETATEAPEENSWPYPYTFKGYNRFKAPDGYPAIRPPWGQLTAVDLNKGTIKWQIPLGEHPELAKKGLSATGAENYGGPLITEGGLVFIAATMDEKIRAFDKRTGRQLWEAPLPAAGFATPATYSVDGRQYIVVAAGGGKLGLKSGDAYVAFALKP
ncbi:MAG: pyrroloquinoline quinone-dependent dehydrogenase [Phaeodactylibacter sp.]|nr:pyrroloquinoline quinone-dependent dehydrogenase [Phaeodactylibacter sp.]